MKHLTLILTPLLFTSCAPLNEEEKTPPAEEKIKKTPEIKKIKAPTPPAPDPILPAPDTITFVNPEVTENLITEKEKQTISPDIAPPPRPTLNTTVETRPPPPTPSTGTPPAQD